MLSQIDLEKHKFCQGRAEGGEGGVNSRGPDILGGRQIYMQKKKLHKKLFSLSN